MAMQKVGRHSPLSREELHERLQAWLIEDELRIDGETEGYGNSAWVYVRDGGRLFRLNRDTKQQGVQEYLRLVRQFGPDLPWEVRPNNNLKRPKENAVAFGPQHMLIKRFYLYLV